MSGPTWMERIAALGVLAGIAVVVIVAGWLMLSLWLSAGEYIRAAL